MKVNVVSRKFIKPSTSTPQNLSKHKISFVDEISPRLHVSFILFYPPNPNQNPKQSITRLQESLARVLTQFYPLAGRYIKRDHSVDCNDEGAEFLEAEAPDHIELMDYIAKTTTYYDDVYDLVSRNAYHEDVATDPLLSVQTTEFKCGGLAVAISISHRIADVSSVATFIAAWSNASSSIVPNFDCSSSLFPGENASYDFNNPPPDLVLRRLRFSKEAISSLRSKLRSPKNARGLFISRVRLVTAFITKALIGVEIAKYGEPRACCIVHLVNMRGRITPPLPKHSFGNLMLTSCTELCTDEQDRKPISGFEEIVDRLGDSIEKTIRDCANITTSLDRDERIGMLTDPIAKMFEILESEEESRPVWFSDWSKCGFYEVDFGWGKPAWVGAGPPGTILGQYECVLLMETRDGRGIEAWVALKQEDVPYFEQDEDMKLFAVA